MKALQRVANRTQLTVCPPPMIWTYEVFHSERERKREEKKVEVDRMPINSVRNTLLNPHEEMTKKTV
ncbi:unnamed protein product [Sphenostylis stenocarpa]|uniref:Uncharacterized protein n=1 Tax=Sphenostylis stenocarpa TaxID=92480 RepID=A0AA86STV1_9FABA|nr:unnamed protein product [Sphenostylis stenocarpa]